MPRGNGGIIGPANIPTQSSAKGVWSLSELTLAVRQSIWPLENLSADPYFEYTTLLLPGSGTNGAQNNTFLDSSTNNFTITRNGNTTQGTFSPFSQTGWGGAFNTSTTYLTVTDTSNLRFGSSNFTIEAFVYRAASGATQTIASKGASTPTGWVFQISSADKLVFTDTSTSITGATSLAANTWYYVAVVRAGTGSNQTTLYVNAVSDATGTSATTFSQTDNMKIGADRSNTNFANGYISNLRLSNTNRTISSTPTSALAADSNTIFLGLYNNRFQYTDSTAAFTNMTVTGTPSVQAFSPFNPTSSWSAATYGGSGYFDGSGDYLQMPSNAAFQFGTGDFCLEAWIYPTNSGSQGAIWGQRGGSSGDNAWVLACNPPNQFSNGYIYFHTNITGVLGTNIAVAVNSWTHVVFTCVSGRYRIFQNGVLAGTTTGSYNFSETTGPRLGAEVWSSGIANFQGYIATGRITKGGIPSAYSTSSTTVGTQIFTPPTTPITSSDSLTAGSLSVLLNFTNSGIYDATSKNDLETVDGAQISNTTAKFGSTSIKFDGTGDYLAIPTSQQLNLSSGNWTVECWVNAQATGFSGLLSWRNTGATSLEPDLYVWNTGVIVWYFNSAAQITGTTNIVGTGWVHVAVAKSGSSTRLFVNGNQEGSTLTDNNTYLAPNTTLKIGAQLSASQWLNGYMQDVRITKGYARYTANFTPPTAAFPTL